MISINDESSTRDKKCCKTCKNLLHAIKYRLIVNKLILFTFTENLFFEMDQVVNDDVITRPKINLKKLDFYNFQTNIYFNTMR